VVPRAAIEWYGPDRPKWLGELQAVVSVSASACSPSQQVCSSVHMFALSGDGALSQLSTFADQCHCDS
jgi:hypothetical protein